MASLIFLPYLQAQPLLPSVDEKSNKIFINLASWPYLHCWYLAILCSRPLLKHRCDQNGCLFFVEVKAEKCLVCVPLLLAQPMVVIADGSQNVLSGAHVFDYLPVLLMHFTLPKGGLSYHIGLVLFRGKRCISLLRLVGETLAGLPPHAAVAAAC